MALEIERKFMVLNHDFKSDSYEVIDIKQGYIFSDDNKVLRVRIASNHSKIAIKFGEDIVRHEYEYEVPLKDAENLLKICQGHIITKKRYLIKNDGLIWEVDEFLDDNKGLVVAEIELRDENENFFKPNWIGEEVSYDKRFYNHYLSRKPFSTW
ncbi:MAG: adenylate cyclase [Candidatus Marinimicrobia bacterium]|nr:adenylate cyclase [Candidatus Neomarinimicrobiota bacterium]|tara:strand:- start:93 stop:554 length:462 start_codon:yes stop_codon:yes gene_type:complete